MELALDSPVGRLVIRAHGDAISDIGFASDTVPGGAANRASPLLCEAARQLRAYFKGKLREFDLPLAPGGSLFQRHLWREMRRIPYGETRSYGDMARLLDSAPRAVGAACGRNPLTIVIPCHRIIGANGALTGYSGGEGLRTKRFLLALEGARAARSAA